MTVTQITLFSFTFPTFFRSPSPLFFVRLPSPLPVVTMSSKVRRFNGKFIKKSQLKRLSNLCKGLNGEKVLSATPDNDALLSSTFNTENERSESTCDTTCTAPIMAGNTNNTIIEGRRIIDIGFLAQQMICEACGGKLHLLDITEEKKYGLASMFVIICPYEKCRHRNTVSTSKRREDTKGPYVVNCKTVLGKHFRSSVTKLGLSI